MIMKRFFFTAIAALCAAATMAAQDMSQATDTYNNGASSLSLGDNEGALAYFQQALTLGEACGEEGADIVNDCKDIIPKIYLQIAKDKIGADDFDNAIVQLQKAIETAKGYSNNQETIDEATDLIPKVYLSKANNMLNDKKFAEAAELYKQVISLDPANGMAFLRLGMAYGAAGNIAEAENAYLEAAKNGQESNAYKQLSNIYVKLAAANLKAKKYDDAITNAVKSNEYQENATALKVAGQAASQLNKNDDAIKYFEKYIEISPNAKDGSAICCTIAVLAQQSGNKEKAIEYYQKIVSDPQYGTTAKQQLEALMK